MIARLIEAHRRAKALKDVDRRLAAMRLGMSVYEREESDVRRRAGNALAGAMIVIGSAGFVFAATDPIVDTLAAVIDFAREMLRALS